MCKANRGCVRVTRTGGHISPLSPPVTLACRGRGHTSTRCRVAGISHVEVADAIWMGSFPAGRAQGVVSLEVEKRLSNLQATPPCSNVQRRHFARATRRVHVTGTQKAPQLAPVVSDDCPISRISSCGERRRLVASGNPTRRSGGSSAHPLPTPGTYVRACETRLSCKGLQGRVSFQ